MLISIFRIFKNTTALVFVLILDGLISYFDAFEMWRLDCLFFRNSWNFHDIFSKVESFNLKSVDIEFVMPVKLVE